MNIFLAPELEKIVQSKVASGLYLDESEVMREALRLMIQADVAKEYHDKWLRAKIEIGVQQADRGECTPFDMEEIINEVLAEKDA